MNTLTKEQAKPGATVIYIGIPDEEKETTVLMGGYDDPELGFMVKTSLYPGGMPLSKFKPVLIAENIEIVEQPQTVTVSVQTPAIEFKGKIAGDTEETVITPALIAEKSKPLLELKITGIHDTKGAEEVKKAITKAVKMRTAVEPMVKDLKGKLKTQYEAALTKVDDVANPIFEACRSTQNTLQKTYDDWQAKVTEAREKEEAEHKAKTDGREKKMFELGLTWNGTNFVGYGKSFPKEGLFAMNDEHYAEFITELEGLQMEHGVTGKPAEEVFIQTATDLKQALASIPWTPSSGFPVGQSSTKPYPTAIFDETVDGVRFVITEGRIADPEATAKITNKQILNSKYFVQAIGK